MIVCLDTNIVVYVIETDAVWTPKADARVAALRAAGDEVAVCDAAILKCLIGPMLSGDAATEAAFRAYFSGTHVRRLPVSAATWERAARLGADFNFKPMDSLH
ncbi:MAG: PIN domain-containing protein, partial [Gemmataceae bacterium]|nr:PIN domain-containing protein [Gemmataceae bacterium]